jgi:hypothetical protein
VLNPPPVDFRENGGESFKIGVNVTDDGEHAERSSSGNWPGPISFKNATESRAKDGKEGGWLRQTRKNADCQVPNAK